MAPIYDFQCIDCKKISEVTMKIAELEKLKACENGDGHAFGAQPPADPNKCSKCGADWHELHCDGCGGLKKHILSATQIDPVSSGSWHSGMANDAVAKRRKDYKNFKGNMG